VHKISTCIHIYENRKIKREKEKKEKVFSVSWTRGGFRSSERARARGHADGRPNSVCQQERRGDDVVGAGLRASEGEGETTLGGVRRGGSAGRENRSPELNDGSPPVIWFRVVGEVAKHG
jgi:hypothetical protein